MFKRKASIKKYSALLSSLVLLGLFVCVVHIVPQSHHVTDTHNEHSNNLATCIDHQISLSPSQKDYNHIVQIAILPETSIVPELALGSVSFLMLQTDLYDPPNKTPLYIKHNTFLI